MATAPASLDASDVPRPSGAEATAAGSDAAIFGERTVTHYERSPADLLRVLVFAVLSLVLMALVRWAAESLGQFEAEMIELLAFLTPVVERLLAGAVQVIVVIVGLGLLVVPLATRRFRLFGYLILGNVVTTLLVQGAEWLVAWDDPVEVINRIAQRAGVDVAAFPNTAGMASLITALVIAGPFVSRRWRRAGAWVAATVIVLQLVVSVHLPAELAMALAIGALSGAAVLLAFGRPNSHPSLGAVGFALRSVGLPVVELAPADVDARGSTPFFATLDDGGRVFVKVLGTDERAADLLFRIYRYLRFKGLGDERPFSSLRRTVEHEALVALQARDLGIRTPRLRSIAEVDGGNSMLLAYDMIAGGSLDRVEPDRVDDPMLGAIWEQVALLRRSRIAHRDLRRANLFVGADGAPWVIDFGFSEVAASDALLAADVAQLMASLSVAVGSERSVGAAIDVLGTDAVGDALPRLQPGALSGATRTALKEHPGLLKELQDQVIDQAHVEQPEYEQLHRISGKTILSIVMLALVTYFLVPQLADMPGIVRQVQDANWAYVPFIVLASFVTYVGAAIGLQGSVPDRLPFRPDLITQLASSFAGKLAPSSVGGMALNVRYLQKSGVDPAVAVSAIGLNTVAGLVMHVVLMLLFLVWAGRNAFGSIHLPDPTVFLYGVAVVVVLAVIVFAVPGVRHAVFKRVLPIMRRSVDGIVGVVRRPGHLAALLGGSILVTLSYIVSIYLSMLAFGGDLRFVSVGAIYLTASAVAVAAPTPGGLGALEAALIAGLVAAGESKDVAVPAVFLFRLGTYWLPILPGYFCFAWMRRHDYV